MLKKIIKPALVGNTIFSIEGNIGCGKSTILDYIAAKNEKNFLCIQEPVSQWSKMENGTDILKLFYENKGDWSFCFENLVQLSRLKTYNNCQNYVLNNSNIKDIKMFVERSIYSSYHVFVKNTYEENRLNKIEFDILTKYFQFFTNQPNNNNNDQEAESRNIPLKFIYIKSTPDTCLERIKQRNRVSEQTIQLDYLIKLNNKYEDWILKLDKSNLIVLDGNLGKEKVFQQIDKLF